MSKVTAPLLSLGAKGTIGKTTTFANWKGIPYARQRVDPANPNTVQQQATRNVFRTAGQTFRFLPAASLEVWEAFAKGRPITPQNGYTSRFVTALRGQSNFGNWVTSPGARGGATMAAFGAVTGAGAGEINVNYNLPIAAPGWSITKLHIVYTEDGDPAQPFQRSILWDEDTALTGTATLSSLTPSTAYIVTAFLEWVRPDGQKAWGVSQGAIATSGA